MAVYDTTLSGARGEVITNGWARQICTATAIVALTTEMIDNTNDDIGLFSLPAGAVIVGGTISATDMDGGSGLAIDVGDSVNSARLFAASTVGQGATLSTALAPAGHLHKYTAETAIRATIETVAAGTPAAGTLKVSIHYFVDPEFSTTALTASAA